MTRLIDLSYCRFLMSLAGRSLLDISDLSREELLFLLNQTKTYKKTQVSKDGVAFSRQSVALLFFEPSTRTRLSFETAAHRLGLSTINLEEPNSSAKKGETIFDTARNIDAMRPLAMVIRHSGSGIPGQVSRLVNVPVINAGDGFHAHPTQALLDAFTIYEAFNEFKGLRVVIIGDIAHSRVARSNIQALRMLGAQVSVCAPPTLLPPQVEKLGVGVSYDLDDCIHDADVVMCLRLQMERQNSFQVPTLTEFTKRFGLTLERLEKIKETALILHPGPINRGVEMMSVALRDPRCRVIQQVENGVLIRTVLLSEILGVAR